ncbi:MAG: hypothetical protein ACRDTZ_05955 [Pseudonocardiaceae bacterium]
MGDDGSAGIVREVTSALTGTCNQLEWSEDEIGWAVSRYPADGDTLYHGFRLLVPTRKLMVTEFVYRSHCRELLVRLVNDHDTRPGTAAEVCCALSEVSQVAPMRLAATGLYIRMWTVAFPDQRIFDGGEHYEALEGSAIDDAELVARSKLAVGDRRLGAIVCAGRHHGESVQCKYAGTN